MTRVENVYALSFAAPIEPLIPELEKRVKNLRKTEGGIEITVDDVTKLNAVLDYLRSSGMNITGMTEKKHTLEQVFLETLDKPADGKVA
jgi:hypothetical protein